MAVDESRSFGTAMAVINTNIRRRGRGEDLTLILQIRIGLNHSNRVVTGGVGLQVHVPKPISAASSTKSQPQTALERPVARAQHTVSVRRLRPWVLGFGFWVAFRFGFSAAVAFEFDEQMTEIGEIFRERGERNDREIKVVLETREEGKHRLAQYETANESTNPTFYTQPLYRVKIYYFFFLSFLFGFLFFFFLLIFLLIFRSKEKSRNTLCPCV